MKQGELYRITKKANFPLTPKAEKWYGTLVVYIREDRKYANAVVILLPNGEQYSLWSGFLEPIK